MNYSDIAKRLGQVSKAVLGDKHGRVDHADSNGHTDGFVSIDDVSIIYSDEEDEPFAVCRLVHYQGSRMDPPETDEQQQQSTHKRLGDAVKAAIVLLVGDSIEDFYQAEAENELFREETVSDDLRCRYEDCPEQHPLAAQDENEDPIEPITCPTCRQDLGLDPT